jgi:hypothetical protein
MQYVLKRDLIEHARFRALATAITNKDKASEIFEEYRKEAFPWVETQKNRDTQNTVRLLQEEVKRGAMGIRPLWEATKKVRSRMKTRIVEAERPDTPQRSKEEMNKLYSKLKTSPV